MKLRALFVTASVSALALGLVHCGGDDTSIAPADGGADGATKDVTVPVDSATGGDTGGGGSGDASDATVPDAHADADAGADAEAHTDADAGADAEAHADAGADVDAADAAPPVLCSFDETSDGTAHVLGIYTLPPTSMQVMVPYLTAQDLTLAITNGAGTTDAPGPGSGLEYGGNCTFYGVGDRGPNGDTPDGGKTFPIPSYTPTVMKLRLDPASRTLLVDGVVNLRDNAGTPVTGLPNEALDDIPFLNVNATTPLPFNQDGLDTEDLRRLPNGDFAFSEEYSPSIGIIDGTTGKVKVRYVPAGVSLPNAAYPVKPVLPAVLANRRSNKGLEGLALSPDGKTAYAVLQAPMGDEATYGKTFVNRIVRVEHFDEPDAAVTTGHFIVLHQAASLFGGSSQKKIYYNSAAWLAENKILVLERGSGHMHLVVVDVSAATNLVGKPAMGENNLDPESLAAGKGYAALGITPAAITDVFTSDDVPSFITTPPDGAVVPDKLEGLAIINKTTVAISNDNDFGIVDAADRSRIWVLRLKAPLLP